MNSGNWQSTKTGTTGITGPGATGGGGGGGLRQERRKEKQHSSALTEEPSPSSSSSFYSPSTSTELDIEPAHRQRRSQLKLSSDDFSSINLSTSSNPLSPTPEILPHPPGNALVLLLLFLLVFLAVILLVYSLPPMTELESAVALIPAVSFSTFFLLMLVFSAEYLTLVFPTSHRAVRDLSHSLSRYRNNHYYSVLTLFVAVYVSLQSFAIPGPIFLSLLAGPLFGLIPGLIYVTICATVGATICYCFSFYLGRGLAQRFFPVLLESFRSRINKQRKQNNNLFYYLLFLRISPLLPNYFINIASPLLDVPMTTFVSATFIGLIPANYIHVSTGLSLESMSSAEEGEESGGWQATLLRMAGLLALACAALLPTLFSKKFEQIEKQI